MTGTAIRSIQKGGAILIPAVLLSLLVAGCGPSLQEMMAKDRLEKAKAFYEQVKSNPDAQTYAPVPLYDAQKAINAAEQAEDYQEMEHLSYLAEKKSQMVMAIAEQRKAEKEIGALRDETDQLVLQKRDQEAKLARKEAEKSRVEAEAKSRDLEGARQAALAEAEKAAKARAQADQLAKEVAELKAKETDRGIVLTMGDVLFATGKATLFPGAVGTISKLADFLKKYPNRNVLIEGHTDSVGGEEYNLGLSQKRADAVKAQLLAEGISPERIFTKGYGKEYPVASNDTAAGRQQNRRVEVVILQQGVRPDTQFR